MQEKDNMKIVSIVAIDKNRGIGKDGEIQWFLPADLKHFVEMTKGHTIIAGRPTYESFRKRPLPNRKNIILSRREGYFPEESNEDTYVRSSYEGAIALAKELAPEKDIYILGGGEVYLQTLSHPEHAVDRVVITYVDASPEADTFFPELNPLDWRETILLEYPADEKNAHSFIIKQYDRFMASI